MSALVNNRRPSSWSGSSRWASSTTSTTRLPRSALSAARASWAWGIRLQPVEAGHPAEVRDDGGV